MKMKTAYRTYGGFKALATASIIALKGPEHIYNFLLSDAPLEQKFYTRAALAAGAILFADGITDLCKGTFFYLPLSVQIKLTKNKEIKKKLENALEQMLKISKESIILPD